MTSVVFLLLPFCISPSFLKKNPSFTYYQGSIYGIYKVRALAVRLTNTK